MVTRKNYLSGIVLRTKSESMTTDSETIDFQAFIDNHVKIKNSDTHHQLQEGLEHLWQHHTAMSP
jgi:hypothetical protein